MLFYTQNTLTCIFLETFSLLLRELTDVGSFKGNNSFRETFQTLFVFLFKKAVLMDIKGRPKLQTPAGL